MTFVVGDACIRCKFTDCVEVCPVDCFHEGPNMLVINPDECIDCSLCAPGCPVEAIYPGEELPEEQGEYLQLNADLSKKWPNITATIAAPDDADAWRDVSPKRHLLDEGEA